MIVNNRELDIEGKFIRISKLKEEWYENLTDAEFLIRKMKSKKCNADIFTFWQRLPEIQPKYDYHMEWDNVAALQIKDYDYWWNKQINAKTRNLVRKAEKKDVIVKMAEFDNDFISGIMNIFNETPIRQGKPFWHYGKNFETIKKEFSSNIHREDIIGAYYNGLLIGFIMLAHTDQYSMLTQIISMIEYRNRSPNNALIAKAVKICAEKNIPYLIYSKWSKSGLGDFKRHNGFAKVNLPRYFIPLSIKGKIALALNLHHGAIGLIPEKQKKYLRDIRTNLNLIRYQKSLKN